MKVLRQELSPLSTSRRCSKCSEKAKYSVYLPSAVPSKKEGTFQNYDKSARRFACAQHGER